MDRTKVAMWAACFSANSTNPGNLSIAEYSVNCGAKSAVGFTNSVTFSSSKTFTNRFFKKLATGASVLESAKHGAKGLLWPWDNAKDYVIFGDEDITVFDVTPSTSTFNLRNINYNIVNELDETYISYQLEDNIVRYYKTINNYLTNSFVDLEYDKFGNLIAVEDYRKEASLIKPINENYMEIIAPNNIDIDNKTFTIVSIDSCNIIYYMIETEFIPIEIKMVTYKNEMEIIQVPICVNIFNGQVIDYSIINSIDN